MAAGQAGVSEASIRKVALASFIGTAIEWYDYFLYGTAALVFNVLFFPESERGLPAAPGSVAAYDRRFGVARGGARVYSLV